MRRVLRNMGWLLGARGVNAALSLAYLALATRCLGLSEFGQFAIIVGLGQAITGLATFQTWQFMVRLGARDGRADDAIGFALALDGISVVVGTVLAGLTVTLTANWLAIPATLLPTSFAFCVISLLSIRSTPTGILRLHDRYGLATVAESVTPIIRAIGAGVAALVMPTITGFLAAWAAAEIASAASYWIFAIREERPKLSVIGLRGLTLDGGSPWPFVWATNLSGSLAVASRQILLLVVGALGGAALAGGFRVAAQLGFALLKLAQAVSRAVYPELVRDGQSAPGLASRMTAVSGIAGLVAVVLAAFFGKWALDLVAGPAFVFSHWAMVILAAGAAVELAGASPEALLVAQGRAGIALLLRAVPTAIALAFLPLAIDQGGLAGAAVCVLISSILAFAGFLRATRNAGPVGGSHEQVQEACGPAIR